MRDIFNTTHYVVGKNFNFGKGNYDDHEIMRGYANLQVVDIQRYKDQRISSSTIKLLIEEGSVEDANKLLGFNYIYKGEVVHGEKRGRELGFPTANIEFTKGVYNPAEGIYSSYITVKGKRYPSVTSISSNPTFEDKEVKYETHIFDFDEMIYGEQVYVELLTFLRRPVKYEGPEKLIEQINKDIERARKDIISIEK
jgi:riboflavin kinase/FMN adenylyltransferase